MAPDETPVNPVSPLAQVAKLAAIVSELIPLYVCELIVVPSVLYRVQVYEYGKAGSTLAYLIHIYDSLSYVEALEVLPDDVDDVTLTIASEPKFADDTTDHD
jgi:hypothetical protein